MRPFLVLAGACGLLAACGGSSEPAASTSPSPTPVATSRPTQALTYGAGEADLTVSGGKDATFTVALDATQATFHPDDGFDVWWRSGDQALNLSGDVKSGEADVFVRVETGPADAFVDPFHTQCDVAVTTYDDTTLAGTFSCDELMPWGEDTTGASPQPVAATGTFVATVVNGASASP